MSNAFDKASLVMLPHAYEDGKLYSLKPTDRSGDFTFSRGSDTATRVGEDGYIKKETANLLLQSNTFDTTWTTYLASVTSGQSGYDGSNDAWLLTKTGASGQIIQNITNSGVQSISIYAKSGTKNWARITLGGLGTTFVNLSNGTFGVDQSISSSAEDAGNGWYRISCTFNGTSSSVIIFAADGDNDVSGTSGTIYIQDAQLNQGLVAQDYLETTTAPVYGGLTDNMPRIDYTDATCPSLLLEPSRTNFITSSEYRSGGTNASVVNNSTLSPEGASNGCLFIENTALNVHGVQFSNTIPTNANAVNRTISVFAKAKEREHIQLSFYADSVSNNSSFFDIVNGTTTGDPNTHKIEDYGNGWYRCSFTANVLQSTGSYNLVRFVMSNGSSNYYSGDGTSGLYMWGLQVEEGSYPTSYIPTYGSSQTRLRDSTFASVTNTTSRTYFLDGKRLANKDISNTSPVYDPNDNLKIAFWSNNRLRFRFGGGVNQYYTLIGDNFKIALSYNGTDSKIFVNGQYWTTQTSFDLGNVSVLTINGNESISYNQLLLFPTALSDSECISLTTL